MTSKMTNKLDLFVSAIARKFGYVSQKKAALGFAEGWYMHNERAVACWQSVEEAFANSELQDSLSENIEFRKGELTQFYLNSLPPIEKLSFSKCIKQKEGFMLVPTANVHTFYQDDDEPENCCNDESEFDLLGDCLDDGDIMVVNKITSAQMPSEKFYGAWVVDASKRKFELFVSYAEAAQAIKAAQEDE